MTSIGGVQARHAAKLLLGASALLGLLLMHGFGGHAAHAAAPASHASPTATVSDATAVDRTPLVASADHPCSQGCADVSAAPAPGQPTPGGGLVALCATVLLALLTWTVLAVQLFFAPMLLRRETRNLVAGVAIGVNVLFAVVLATPWSSLAVIAVTGLFVSDDRWAALGERVADLAWPVLDRTADVRYAVADRVADWWYDRVLGLWDRVRFSVFRR